MDLEVIFQDFNLIVVIVFRNLGGVYWGYEEIKIYFVIFSEIQFYEIFWNCYCNSQLYGVVVKRLWEYGFFRILEQCWIKFKSL